MRIALLLGLVAVGSLLAACGSDFQASDGGGGTTSGTGGTGTGGSASGQAGDGGTSSGGGSSSGSPCDEPLQFVPAVPSDWDGPLLLAIGTSDEVPDCPDGATGQGVVKRGLNAPAMICECTCGALQASACSAELALHQSMGCTGTPHITTTVADGGCLGVIASVSIQSYHWGPQPAPPGVCPASPGTQTKPAITWDEYARVCLMSWQTCMDGPPSPFEPTYCIHKGGAQACPTGAYSERSLFYTEVDDQRACDDDCSCDASGVDCQGTLTAYPQVNCSATVPPNPTVPGCKDVNATPQSAEYEADPAGTCTPQNASATGGATATGAFTVCCLP